MPISIGTSGVKEIYVGGAPVSAVYAGTALVWSSAPQRLQQILGVEAATLYVMQNDAGTFASGNRAAKILDQGENYRFTLNLGSSYRQTTLWAYIGDNAQVTWQQGDRIALRMTTRGGKLRCESYGDRKAVLDFTTTWPGGYHWVLLNTYDDWYGYRMRTFVDGVGVETATNGGAFALSENVFTSGSTLITSSGDVAVVAYDWSGYKNEVTSLPAFRARLSTNVWVETVTKSGDWSEALPGADIAMWLYQGGQGGQGGRGGSNTSAGSSGSSGRNGVGVRVTNPPRSGTLRVGAGGEGGRYGSSGFMNGETGEAGALGGHTSLGAYTTNGATTRPTPSAFGETADALGAGGSGGSGGSQGDPANLIPPTSGSDGSNGKVGGMVVIYRWPKT